MQSRQSHGWAFIDQAERGINSGRTYMAVLLRVVLYPLGIYVLLLTSGIFIGVGFQVEPPAHFAWLFRIIAQIGAIAVAVAPFAAIAVAGLVLVDGVPRHHRRPWQSLVAPGLRLDWRRLAIGISAEAVIVLAQLMLIHALTGWPWRFALPAVLPVVAVTLLLIPLQAASEELLFRGYLTQALGRIVRRRAVIAALVALVFGVLHLNRYGPLTMPYFFLWSLVFSLVSLRDDRLELAIGGHAAMNFLSVATAAFSPFVPAIVGVGEQTLQFNWATLAVPVAHGALFYGLTRLLVRLFCPARAIPARS